MVSPTGKVYEAGTPPEETRFSQTASLYIRRGRLERALELAREGREADPENPIHHYLAGVAHARLGNHQAADQMFTEAERLYPAYELDIEPEREAAWVKSFNAGTDAYADGDVEGAIEAWRGATAIHDLEPAAHRNLASLLTGEGRYEEAIGIYRKALKGLERRHATRVLEEREIRAREEVEARIEESLARLLLFRERYDEAEPLLRRRLRRDSADVQARSDLATALDELGRENEAGRLYDSLLSESTLEPRVLFKLGVALFRARRHVEASQAFGRLTELQPNSRDAWFNYANSLFAARRWEELASMGHRLVEVDPLGENAALIVARAHVESGDRSAARAGIERTDAAPVYLEKLQMQPSGGETVVRGRVIGNRAEPGTPVRVRFTFHAEGAKLGSEILDISAPEPGESDPFEVSFPDRAESYRYQPLP